MSDILKCTTTLSQFKKPIISMTGSCGKTTTCKMIQEMLQHRYIVNKTHENSNSMLGIPWCVNTYFKNDADIWLIELGISKPNDMDKLMEMVTPTIRIMTNVCNAHVSNFSSLKEYQTEKLKFLDYIQENDVAIINNDDPVLSTYMNDNVFPPSVKIINCGSKDTDDVQFIKHSINSNCMSSTVTIRINRDKSLITFNLDGINEHNAFNCCLAVGCAIHFNIPIDTIKKTLNKFKLYKHRGLIVTNPKFTIYDHTYNGVNHAFMKNIESFKCLHSKNKLIILGISETSTHVINMDHVIQIIEHSLKVTNKIIIYTTPECSTLLSMIQQMYFKNIFFANSFDIVIEKIRLLSSLEKLDIYIQGDHYLKLFDLVNKLIA
jgi:UDP-N-acetylmuramoyl-tripeptide--D-alanyl-D-alanine ligase